MSLSADQIAIAVTVFDRREYLVQAIDSALNQTVPVRVFVLEDRGADAALEGFVKTQFGSRVQYNHNPHRKGLFGTANTCLRLSPTPWLSILHDDDYLDPHFVETMLDLYDRFPHRGLYFGGATVVNVDGTRLFDWPIPGSGDPRELTLDDLMIGTPCPFVGHLLNVAFARTLGGFRETSQYCGDWELWARVVLRHGGACTSAAVGFSRQDSDPNRPTNQVVRSGREYPLNYVQMKRTLHLLRDGGVASKVDRIAYQIGRPVPTRFLLRYGVRLSPRILSYHRRLLLLSRPPHVLYAVFQLAVCMFGEPLLRFASRVWNWGLTDWRTRGAVSAKTARSSTPSSR